MNCVPPVHLSGQTGLALSEACEQQTPMPSVTATLDEANSESCSRQSQTTNWD
jgi:hypothetical protein